MKESKRIQAWFLYLVAVVVTVATHACAVEFDLQADPATAAARQA